MDAGGIAVARVNKLPESTPGTMPHLFLRLPNGKKIETPALHGFTLLPILNFRQSTLPRRQRRSIPSFSSCAHVLSDEGSLINPQPSFLKHNSCPALLSYSIISNHMEIPRTILTSSTRSMIAMATGELYLCGTPLHLFKASDGHGTAPRRWLCSSELVSESAPSSDARSP